jgi:hypothetical protein
MSGDIAIRLYLRLFFLIGGINMNDIELRAWQMQLEIMGLAEKKMAERNMSYRELASRMGLTMRQLKNLVL